MLLFFLSLSSIYNTVASCGPVGSMWPRVKRIRLVIRGSQVRIPLWLWCSSIKKKKKKNPHFPGGIDEAHCVPGSGI